MDAQGAQGAAGGPVVLVGFSGVVLGALSVFLPDQSMIFVDEPDVVRKREVRTATANSPKVSDVIEWEYQLDGTADAFYNAHRDLNPSAVVPIIEYGVPFAARLAERYGVPGASYGAACALRDKHQLRRVTAAAGIPNPRSVEVGGPDEVRAFMAEVGAPIVLKPTNRQGSVGTQILRHAAEVDEAWADCIVHDETIYVPDRPMPLRMLAEQFVSGDEYSVEMMVSGGRSLFGGVTQKFLFPGPYPVEQGHLHPADISQELTGQLLADTELVMDAIGMDTGFVHCEWMVSGGVPYLIECAGRMAGDGIIELARLAWEYDVVVEFYALMRRLPLSGPAPAAPPAYAAVWTASTSTGEVDSVDGVDAAKALPGVQGVIAPSVGEAVHQLRSSWHRPVFVMSKAATANEALTSAQKGVDLIDIKVRPPVQDQP